MHLQESFECDPVLAHRDHASQNPTSWQLQKGSTSPFDALWSEAQSCGDVFRSFQLATTSPGCMSSVTSHCGSSETVLRALGRFEGWTRGVRGLPIWAVTMGKELEFTESIHKQLCRSEASAPDGSTLPEAPLPHGIRLSCFRAQAQTGFVRVFSRLPSCRSASPGRPAHPGCKRRRKDNTRREQKAARSRGVSPPGAAARQGDARRPGSARPHFV